ncbi:MAG: hypothetical protein CMM47_01815 [Rhodospirillaceae bacterium]|nr:hypothetical protein [Rhodospirillaceae bacterium]|tara:strand:+ start:102 stop:572 length:471 start_codon:yes stop_codon:yes gene_type:complete
MAPNQELRSEFLGELVIQVSGSHIFGETPMGQMRRVDYFDCGHFKGPKIDAQVVRGSADALLQRFDGVVQPDVRLTLKTSDGHHLLVRYRGFRHAAPDVMQRIEREERVESGEVYLRTAMFFETDSPSLTWLNQTLAIGVGRRDPKAAIYDVYEIL